VLGSVRGDFHHIDTDGNSDLHVPEDSRNDNPFSADAGIVYAPVQGLSVAANYGRAWRSPTLFELYSNGPHLGEARYEIGDPDLAPERGTNLDGSIRWESPRLLAEVAGFRNGIHDFIFITPTNEVRDSLTVFRHTQANALLAGTELGLQCEAHRNLTLRGRFDYVWAENEATNSPLPLIPPAHGTVGATLHWKDLGWTSGSRRAPSSSWSPSRRAAASSTRRRRRTRSCHLEGGLAQYWGGHPIQWDLAVHNVGNVSYRDYLSRYKDFALDQGINVLLRISTGM
jgi:outer membrane receptor protein involved in Fe transport